MALFEFGARCPYCSGRLKKTRSSELRCTGRCRATFVDKDYLYFERQRSEMLEHQCRCLEARVERYEAALSLYDAATS